MIKHLILTLTFTLLSSHSFASTFRCISNSGTQYEVPVLNGQALISEETTNQSKERFKVSSMVFNDHVAQITITDSKSQLQVGAMAEMQSDSLYIEINQTNSAQSFTCAIFSK